MPPILLYADDAVADIERRYANASGDRAWIAPNPRASQETQQRLATIGPTIRPGVRTLSQLASALVAENAAATRRLTAPQQAELIDRIVANGLRLEVLDAVRPLAASGALARLARRVVNELRLDGVPPPLARSRIEAEQPTASDGLAWVYRRYCDAIKKHGLYDEALINQAAAEQASQRASELVVLHAPLRPYNAVELSLVRAVLGAAREAVLLAARGPGPEALERLAEAWSQELERPVEPQPTRSGPHSTRVRVSPALATVRTRLFSADEEVEKPDGAHRIEVLAASSTQDEVRRVVARVKLWLTDGAADCDDVVLAIPSVDYAERLRLELAAAGVPAAFDRQPPLSRSRWWRRARLLLEVDARDWPYDDLLALVAQTHVSPTEVGADAAQAAAATERFLRDTQAPNGRQYLLRRARQSGNALASVTLEAIDASLKTLPTTAQPLDWFDAVCAAINKLGLDAVGGESRAEAFSEFDDGASASLERALGQIETASRWGDRRPPTWTREEFGRWLGRAPEIVGPSRRREPSPAVRVADYDTAATLRFRRLAVLGLGEAAFSLGRSPTLDIEKQSELARRRFYALVTRPSERLLLSYPALDGKAQATRPCPYVEDLERLFPRGGLRRDHDLLQPVAPRGAVVTPRALRLRAIANVAVGDAEAIGVLRGHDAAQFAATLNAVQAVRVRAAGDTSGPFEGIVPGAAETLGDRFGAAHPWSAGQLERYASCPFRFFARNVLGAEPVDSLELAVDRRRRGSRVHLLLAELHKQMEDRSVTLERVREAIERLYAEVFKTGSAPEHERSLGAVERLQVERWLEAYPEQADAYADHWADLDTPMTPQLFEARFGAARRDEDEEDTRSVEEPLTIDLPRVGTIRVEGTIDRLDVGEHAGTPVFGVIDYKTSRDLKVRPEHVELGLQLQPLLYALAAMEHFMPENAVALFAGYWGVRLKGKTKTLEPIQGLAERAADSVVATDNWRVAIEAAKERIAQIVESVRAGDFPLAPADEKQCAYCDYRRVCRVSQARAVGKLPDEADETEGPARGPSGGAAEP